MKPPQAPPKEEEAASPPSPLRMEKPPPTPPKGGESLTGDSLERLTFIQRGRSFALKGASLHIEERLSLHERNALFICSPAIPANELQPRNTPTDVPLTSFHKAFSPTEGS